MDGMWVPHAALARVRSYAPSMVRCMLCASPTPRSSVPPTGAGAPKTVLVLGLAGCAAEPGPKPSSSASEAAPYVGVFTGEFVDGKPLYRFPPIYVIGSRSSFGPDI